MGKKKVNEIVKPKSIVPDGGYKSLDEVPDDIAEEIIQHCQDSLRRAKELGEQNRKMVEQIIANRKREQ